MFGCGCNWLAYVHRAIHSVHDDRALLVGNKYWKLWTQAPARLRRTNAGLGRTFSPEITLHIPYVFPMTIEPDSKNKWPTCVLAVIHFMVLLRLFLFLSHRFFWQNVYLPYITWVRKKNNPIHHEGRPQWELRMALWIQNGRAGQLKNHKPSKLLHGGRFSRMNIDVV